MKEAFWHLGWFFKKTYKRYIFVAFFLLVLSIIPVLPAKLLGLAIDEISTGILTFSHLLLFIGALLLVAIARYLINWVYHYEISRLGHQLSFELRENYIRHLFELDSETYERYTKGDLISRATNDLQNLTVLATNFLQTVFFNTGVVLSAVFMMMIINSLLTLASVIMMPFAIFWLNKKRLKKRAYYKIHREIYADMTENVLESIEGVKTVRAYANEEQDFIKTKKAIDRDIDSWWKIIKFESIYGPLFELVYTVSYFIAISLGSYMVITSNITAGELITFLMYVGMLYGPLVALSNVLNQVNNIAISDQRYHEVVSIVPKIVNTEYSKPILGFNKIEFKNVVFKYPKENQEVLMDVSFSIEKGKTIGIVGPTGSGKSTMIRQLLREYNVLGGEILIDGIDIKEFNTDDVHDLIGYVPQDHILFRRSVDDNILIGNPRASARDVHRAVALADFNKDLKELPYGLETMVAEYGGSLSGGQRQRLSIARALVRDPEILILDDSLSAVDALTEANIIKNLKEARQGKTNIIIAHRFSAVTMADEILVVENGRITNRGIHEELLKYDNWYKMQYLKQINEANEDGVGE
ncbi:MAG: ABC transporter ATP-binding protein [Bacilli bacterium]|jgi:ATP-binding cassette subfamily B protein|nr:ABC transporter ATP-binding protein [Acholeplasmataceae bacterium]